MPDIRKSVFSNTLRLYYFIATLTFLMWLFPIAVNLTVSLTRRIRTLISPLKRTPKSLPAAPSKLQPSGKTQTSDACPMPQHRRQNR